MLSSIKRRLEAANIVTLDVGHEGAANAAVLLALTDEENPAIILTKRAEHMNTHKGEVALPGGKWEEGDTSLVQTALRESWEEVGLQPSDVDIWGALPSFHTRQGTFVTPYVGVISPDIVLTPNFDELDAIFKVPLSYFIDANRVRTDVYFRGEKRLWSPAYQFEEYEIWGFTARVITQFLNDYAELPTLFDSPAPVRHYGKIG